MNLTKRFGRASFCRTEEARNGDSIGTRRIRRKRSGCCARSERRRGRCSRFCRRALSCSGMRRITILGERRTREGSFTSGFHGESPERNRGGWRRRRWDASELHPQADYLQLVLSACLNVWGSFILERQLEAVPTRFSNRPAVAGGC